MPERQGHLFAVDAGEMENDSAVVGNSLPLSGQRPVPPDAAARLQALDTGCSVLVEAPAGAGKTNLLTQRMLALLAEVEAPEQVLAITFTRAAAAEMRARIFGALASAQASPEPKPGEGDELPLARRALAHAERRGWQLLATPHRLPIETIDSLCLRLSHAQPLLARLGGRLSPAQDPDAMYSEAARRTLAHLEEGEESEIGGALRTLLLRRDNRLPDLERALCSDLARRDAWLGLLPLEPRSEEEWSAKRIELEDVFRREHERALRDVCEAAAALGTLADEWLVLARFAAGNVPAEAPEPSLHRLLLLDALPGATTEDRPLWQALSLLLLTEGMTWRRRWTKHEGFPASSEMKSRADKEQLERFKRRMKACCEAAQSHHHGERLQQALCRLRTLPPLHYTDGQWADLRAVFTVLRRAVAELRVCFAAANQVDFVEIAAAAREVLNDPSSLRGLLESERTSHLLVDEFQDTSRSQMELLSALIREWSAGDGRTIFLVGDPLQSIYGFRQAEVALFHQTRAHGLPSAAGRHPCRTLQLTHNFRSHQALVSELNARFLTIFPPEGADRFVASTAWPAPAAEPCLSVHTQFADSDAGQSSADARSAEARSVVKVLRAELPHIEAARQTAKPGDEYRVAVLVRTRTHLAYILPALRAAGIAFRAVELERLHERPEVHDLLMLLRALGHRADRVAWLSVLRAPWCALSIADLHTLAGEDDPAMQRQPMAAAIETRAHLLSLDGQQRLLRTAAVLRDAVRSRYNNSSSLSLAVWAERTWTALGGPACVDAIARENVEALFALLDTLKPSGAELLGSEFAARLAKLCSAPDPRVSERFGVQVMTIHKAKGLGFAVVLLPALERTARRGGGGVVSMLVRERADQPLYPEVLLAPPEDCDATKQTLARTWLSKELHAREIAETRRLFYVACTRARLRLHLFAGVCVKNGTVQKPPYGSLLHAAWPALQPEVEAQWRTRAVPDGSAPISNLGLALAASADLQSETGVALRTGSPADDDPQSSAPADSAGAAPAGHHWLDRLPTGWMPAAAPPDIAPAGIEQPLHPVFERPAHGSPDLRLRGTALHALLERCSRLLQAGDVPPGRSWQRTLEAAAERTLRAGGFPQARAARTGTELAQIALRVLADPVGHWLLGPRANALVESTWQSLDASGAVRTLRVDRCFRGGSTPGAQGEQYLWIVDYKTSRPPANSNLEQWLGEEQERWRGQLEAYGTAILAARSGAEVLEGLRYGLYFPELLRLWVWAPEA